MQALKTIEVACPLCEAEAGHHCRNILRRGNPEVVWNHYPREDAARDTNLPDGITSFHPIAYGVRRWNGVVWQRYMVEEYNKRLSIIERLHRADKDQRHVQAEIDALYQLANRYDLAQAHERSETERQTKATL